jgi:hypothetical protein
MRMLITRDTSILIKNNPEAIWDYTSDPVNWSASNPEERFGLEIDSVDHRPRTGARFHQKETVAGWYADLRGHFPYVAPGEIAFWRGVATYKILGLIRIRIPEGGVVHLEKTADGTRVSHNVYMDFSDTLLGRILVWLFKKVFHGEKAVYDHTFKELLFFKNHLEQ